jgi:hydrogenase expression/formation protein HypC
MCLAIPGRVLSIDERLGARVDFGGVIKEASLAFVPEARVGDHVIVHVGFALSRLDEQEAQRVFAYLEELGELAQELAP